MPCSKETLVWLFYNISSSSFLLLLLLYFSSSLLLKFLNFIGSFPLIERNQNDYEYVFSDEEEEEADRNTYYYSEYTERDHHLVEYTERDHHLVEYTERDHHLVADIVHGGDSLVFLSNNGANYDKLQQHDVKEFVNPGVYEFADDEEQVLDEDQEDVSFASDEQISLRAAAGTSESEQDDNNNDKEQDHEILTTDADSSYDTAPYHGGPNSPITSHLNKSGSLESDDNSGETYVNQQLGIDKFDSRISSDGKYFVFGPTQLDSRKLHMKNNNEEEIYGDSCTVGSTSKSSSEWRSSIKDSMTEDPFSSSSRRSCQKWESYTVFQKYDEEMMFLDGISAQKLHETESLRKIQVHPRSFSDRIVRKFATVNKRPAEIRRNPYHELETAYVARICLTWEVLNCNYKNFKQKKAAQPESDRGCPARIAQQFQQFQVLLQRYIENEPYEQGRRPEVYARMKLLAPKLLLVPEYRDFEDDEKDEEFGSRIPSSAFLMIMEDGIRTFMNFLKADKEKPSQIILSFLKRNQRGGVDPALLHLMKKVNSKKKMKLKDLRRAGKCIRKRKLTMEEEMEILMGLIDLKVASRVLRMSDLREEQLHWCEEKMSKVKIMNGKLQRDSSPLFFPAH